MLSQYLILAALAASPTTTRMAGVIKATSSGVLTLDKGEQVKLAGVAISDKGKAGAFFKSFLENKVVKLDIEPATGAVHVFVSADCDEAAKLLKVPAPAQNMGGCAQSLYVNRVLLEKKWAKPQPKEVTLNRSMLFAAPKAVKKTRRR